MKIGIIIATVPWVPLYVLAIATRFDNTVIIVLAFLCLLLSAFGVMISLVSRMAEKDLRQR